LKYGVPEIFGVSEDSIEGVAPEPDVPGTTGVEPEAITVEPVVSEPGVNTLESKASKLPAAAVEATDDELCTGSLASGV